MFLGSFVRRLFLSFGVALVVLLDLLMGLLVRRNLRMLVAMWLLDIEIMVYACENIDWRQLSEERLCSTSYRT